MTANTTCAECDQPGRYNLYDRWFCTNHRGLAERYAPTKVELAIEMSDINSAGYGVIHKAGCRDLRDAERIGAVATFDEAQRAADDLTGWEYVADGDPYRVAPCALHRLREG